MAEILTDEQIVAVLEEYKTTAATNKDLAAKYDRTEEAIRRITCGVKKDIVQVDDEDDKIEKAEKNNRLQVIKSLEDEGIDAKEFAKQLKTLLSGDDLAIKRDALKMISDIKGLSAKTDKSAGSGGPRIIEKQYILSMPKRPKE